MPGSSEPGSTGFRTRQGNGWGQEQQGKASGIKKPHLQRAVFFARIHTALPVAAHPLPLCTETGGLVEYYIFILKPSIIVGSYKL